VKIQATTEILQGENVLVRAQLLTEAGKILVDDNPPSDTATYQTATGASVHVYDVTDPGAPATLVNEGDPTQVTDYSVASTFNSESSPWTTSGWRLGGSGFNAGFTVVHSNTAVPSPSLPTVRFRGGRTYRCEFRVTHGGGIVPGLTDGPIRFDVIVHVRSSWSQDADS